MWKLAVVVLIATIATSSLARADVVEPTQEVEPAQAAGAPGADLEGFGAVQAPGVQPANAATRDAQRVRDAGVDGGSSDETPPLSGGRVVGEFLLGGLLSVGGGVGGAYLGFSIETSSGCHSEFCGLGGAVLGGLA